MEKHYTEDEVAEVKTNPRHPSLRIHSIARGRDHLPKQGPLNIKKHEPEIEEMVTRQAAIERLSHNGWPIGVTAWVNSCPTCGAVSEYRAIANHNYRFTIHGPEAESTVCADCADKGK